MKQRQIQISDHFTTGKIIRFALPSIIMMIFTSLYTIVDGLAVSNLVGDAAFSSLNLIWPAIGMMGAFGFMIGSGGNALVSKTLGEKKEHLACEYFTMLIVFEVIVGIIVSALMLIYILPISRLLGATDDLIADCILYGAPLIALQCFFFMSMTFQSFLVTAGKPKLGLYISLAAGFSNMFLDFFFIGPCGFGIFGAALATGINWILSSVVPLIWFARHKDALIHFVRFHWRFGALGRACFNGMSEMVTNLSASFVLMLYNAQLMRLIGPSGVNAFGVIQYIQFLATAIFFGYTMAAAPCIGYQYGAGDHKELSNLLRISIRLTLLASILVTVGCEFSARQLSMVFVSYSASLMDLTSHALRIYAISFLFSGFNILASGFFTALNNGLVSAVLSFGRTFIFQAGAIIFLPMFFGVEGVWCSSVLSELLSAILAFGFLFALRKKYGYWEHLH
ncbi:MATE family efflux transporter [Allobaculum mucilyticum]|uniref:MATE family efflux transporter n=1 Tax=Allobaculum mucilyticum TaxID=2834459 RepID=UPI001E3203FB|nr:MATE family efflux transporter [Allobaculum mucilyticum]UNT95178.1 MATE family efflux transporter [Allobaculum mucilyticum]